MIIFRFKSLCVTLLICAAGCGRENNAETQTLIDAAPTEPFNVVAMDQLAAEQENAAAAKASVDAQLNSILDASDRQAALLNSMERDGERQKVRDLEDRVKQIEFKQQMDTTQYYVNQSFGSSRK